MRSLQKILRHLLFLLYLTVIIQQKIDAYDSLDAIILKDIVPSIGTKCKSNSDIFKNQESSYKFDHEISSSVWDSIAESYEKDLFLAEMTNMNHENRNKSWAFRVGQSGNLYSFQGAFGEAIPPQSHANAEWIDEVTQSVSVNREHNSPDHPYFIHQAGVYTKDGEFTENHPFFSPTIAKHCDKKECFFGSWGQQAHLPTKHKSSLLYFNGYRDCGDGIIEFTSVFHNANLDLENGHVVDYLNVPWGGVRSTTLRDLLLSDPSNSLNIEFPLGLWGHGGLQQIKNTGGFTTFTEEIKVPEDIYGKNPYVMPSQNGIRLQLVVTHNNRAKESRLHSDIFQMYCMVVPVSATFTENGGCRQNCNLSLKNSRTGDEVIASIVIHWSWKGNDMYFCTDGIVDANHFNDKFKGGDEILVSYGNFGKPIDENMAITFIHGTQTGLQQHFAPTRIRYGSAGSTKRDYTAYTTNARIKIDPGDTYVYQQFIVTGRLSDMETIGAEWKGEVYEDLFSLGEMSGTDIHLYSTDYVAFGAYIDGRETCSQGINVCSGKSVPQFGLNPLFSITCGNEKYIGSDKYFFSPKRSNETETIRSYACEGKAPKERPQWKLLGFFEEDSCALLSNASFDGSFCSKLLNSSSDEVEIVLDETLSFGAFNSSVVEQLNTSSISKGDLLNTSQDNISNPTNENDYDLNRSKVSTSNENVTMNLTQGDAPFVGNGNASNFSAR